jgi:hypothetical protein
MTTAISSLDHARTATDVALLPVIEHRADDNGEQRIHNDRC